METRVLSENYGPIKAGVEYQCVDDGLDYVVLKCRGSRYYVPTIFIQKYIKKNDYFLPSYEEIIEEEE